jgi:molybdopterin molybdotransferase
MYILIIQHIRQKTIIKLNIIYLRIITERKDWVDIKSSAVYTKIERCSKGVTMIDLKKALSIIKDNIIFDEVERIRIQESLNRVISEDVFSTMDVVPFHHALVDGYAIMKPNSDQTDRRYKITRSVFAGDEGIKWMDTNCAIKVTTGAMIPDNCNVVLKNEDVILEEGTIIVRRYPELGDGIGRVGNIIKKNSKIAAKGDTVTPEVLEKLIMTGYSSIPVYALIDMAILNTGSELLSIGDAYQNGKIYPSNGFFIAAQMTNYHLSVGELLIVKDNQMQVMDILRRLTQSANLIITTGGVGHGDKDLILDSISALGFHVFFSGVDERGCKNVILSRFEKCFILSLSGNPFAMKRGLEALGKPVLYQLTHKGEFKND